MSDQLSISNAFVKEIATFIKSDSFLKNKLPVALLIIGAMGGFVASGFGLHGLGTIKHWWPAGNLSNLSQIQAILLISGGGGTLVITLSLLVRSLKKKSESTVATLSVKQEEKTPEETPIFKKEWRQELESWVEQGGRNEKQSRKTCMNAIIDCYTNRLTSLNLERLILTSLPKEIALLTHLETLILKHNDFESFPREISQLVGLIKLDLEDSAFQWKDEMHFPPGLIELNLSHNSLKNPALIEFPSSLKVLDLSVCHLKEMPKIGHLKELERLRLPSNPCPLDSEIFELTQLEELDLSNLSLDKVPPEIGNLIKLKALYLATNEFDSLPEEIEKLLLLEKLVIGNNNNMISFPKKIGLLKNLNHLEISDTKISTFPEEICLLTNLKKLHACRLGWTSLPSQIGQLRLLEELSIATNRLTSLPAEIALLGNLKILNLNRNPLTSLPVEILYMQRGLKIYIEGCSFSQNALVTLQHRMNVSSYSGPTIHFSINEHRKKNTKSLPELLEELSSIAKHKPFELINLVEDPSNTKSLHLWLANLSAIGDYENRHEELATRVCQILDKAETEAEFREIFWMCLADAATTCGDRMALSLLYVDVHYQIAESVKALNFERLAYLLGHGLWALDQLGTIAQRKVECLACVDAIEVYLAFPIKLKKALQMPLVLESMLYFACSDVKDEELKNAERKVKASLSSLESFSTYLSGQENWIKALELAQHQEYVKIISDKKLALQEIDPNSEGSVYAQIEVNYKKQMTLLTQKILLEVGLPPFLKK